MFNLWTRSAMSSHEDPSTILKSHRYGALVHGLQLVCTTLWVVCRIQCTASASHHAANTNRRCHKIDELAIYWIKQPRSCRRTADLAMLSSGSAGLFHSTSASDGVEISSCRRHRKLAIKLETGSQWAACEENLRGDPVISMRLDEPLSVSELMPFEIVDTTLLTAY